MCLKQKKNKRTVFFSTFFNNDNYFFSYPEKILPLWPFFPYKLRVPRKNRGVILTIAYANKQRRIRARNMVLKHNGIEGLKLWGPNGCGMHFLLLIEKKINWL